MVARFGALIADLDDTLVDSKVLKPLRDSRRWKEAVQAVGRTQVFPGVRQVVDDLNRLGVPWGVVTASVSYYAERILRHHHLVLAHGHLVAYHDAPPKPSPAGVLLLLQRFGAQPAQAIAMGDAATDCAAYRAAGVFAVGAAWSSDLEMAPWDLVAEEPADLLAFFR